MTYLIILLIFYSSILYDFSTSVEQALLILLKDSKEFSVMFSVTFKWKKKPAILGSKNDIWGLR